MLRDDAPSEEEKQARLQGTVDSFAGLGVIENKLAEAGKNVFYRCRAGRDEPVRPQQV